MYHYTSSSYAPQNLFASHTLLPLHNDWSWHGEHILNLPLVFFCTHVRQTTQDLTKLISTLTTLEAILIQPLANHDFSSIITSIHSLESQLHILRGRFAFESTLLTTLTTALEWTSNHHNQRPYQYFDLATEILSVPRLTMTTRAPQDAAFSSRIATARAMVFNSMLLQNQQESLQMKRLNVEIAISSRRIAEATLRDAASMRTIAVMTMVFLPGTAIAVSRNRIAYNLLEARFMASPLFSIGWSGFIVRSAHVTDSELPLAVLLQYDHVQLGPFFRSG